MTLTIDQRIVRAAVDWYSADQKRKRTRDVFHAAFRACVERNGGLEGNVQGEILDEIYRETQPQYDVRRSAASKAGAARVKLHRLCAARAKVTT